MGFRQLGGSDETTYPITKFLVYFHPLTVPEKHDNGYSLPPADTGWRLLDWISNTLIFFVHVERRIDPLFRTAFDFLFREILTRFFNSLINLQRKNEGYKLVEERPQPDEE